jgi:hypothetical protein
MEAMSISDKVAEMEEALWQFRRWDEAYHSAFDEAGVQKELDMPPDCPTRLLYLHERLRILVDEVRRLRAPSKRVFNVEPLSEEDLWRALAMDTGQVVVTDLPPVPAPTIRYLSQDGRLTEVHLPDGRVLVPAGRSAVEGGTVYCPKCLLDSCDGSGDPRDYLTCEKCGWCGQLLNALIERPPVPRGTTVEEDIERQMMMGQGRPLGPAGGSVDRLDPKKQMDHPTQEPDWSTLRPVLVADGGYQLGPPYNVNAVIEAAYVAREKTPWPGQVWYGGGRGRWLFTGGTITATVGCRLLWDPRIGVERGEP